MHAPGKPGQQVEARIFIFLRQDHIARRVGKHLPKRGERRRPPAPKTVGGVGSVLAGARAGHHPDRRLGRGMAVLRDKVHPLRRANDHGPVSGKLQRRGIAEQPAPGHPFDEILEMQPDRIEKFFDHVAPRKESHDLGGAAHLRQAKAVSVPRMEGRCSQ